MSNPTRRKIITAGLSTAGAASGLAVAAKLADRYGLIPPDGGGIYGPGKTLTYAAQRLLGRHSMAREFARSEISNPPHANGKPPQDQAYLRHQASGFAYWRLVVDGLVARPAVFSVAELKSFPSRSQITHQACEEGWSSIAEWTGVPLSHVLNLVGVLPQARYAVVFTIQRRWWGSMDLDDAFHPQTLLAYGINGGELSPARGAPIRLRVPRQLAYKSLKYITNLKLTDSMKDIGNGLGASSAKAGYSWYAGI